MLPTPPFAALVRRITPNSESVSDAELIERFARSADQAAFELLVWRHGAMVWGACRRMLAPDHHAAEDACQAAFVALAMHSDRLRNCGAVAAWLHRVAVRAALDLAAARRSVLPLADSLDPIDLRPGPEQVASGREIRTLIDAGLDRLPDNLRVPFVLCELEGRSNAEAAAALGCPVGTVESRLTRARQRLRIWLRSRGVAPALALAAAAFPGSLRAALVRVGAARSAIKPTVRTLAERAVRSAVAVKLRFVLALGIAMIATAIGFGLEGGDPPKDLDAPPAKAAGPKATGARPADALALPPGAIARLGSPRMRHGSRLKDIAYSPNGKRIASVGYDNTLRAWDAKSGQPLFAVPRPDGGFDKVSFAAGGAAIVALGRDRDNRGALWRIDAATGRVLGRLKLDATLPKSTMPEAAAVRFSPDGSRLALGRADKKLLVVIDTASAAVIWAADLAKEVPGGVAFAPDGKTVAATTRAGRVHLFDRDGKPAGQFKTGQDAELSSVALSPDGKLLAARNNGSPSCELIAWDQATGRIVWTREHKGGHGLAFTPDSTIIVECGSRSFASTVDAADGMPPGKGNRRDAIFESMAEVRCLALHPAGKVVAFGTDSGTINLFDVTSRKPVTPTANPSRSVERLRFSADGKTLYGWALDWLAWDVATGKQRYVTNEGGWNFYMPLSPDGKYTLRTGLEIGGLLGGARIDVCDVATGKAVFSLRSDGLEDGFAGFDFTPDGKAILGGQAGGSMQIRSFAGDRLARMRGHHRLPQYRAFSASGRVMVTALVNEPAEAFPVRVWDLKSGKELAKFNPGAGPTGNGHPYGSLVALSGDGRRVAALPYANSYAKPEPREFARVWDVASGKLLASVPQGGDSGYVALSPDGRTVAVSALWKSDVWVYEVAGGGERFHFRHAGEVTGLAFAADGGTLAAASKEAPVYLWDVSGKLAGPVPGWNAGAADRVWADLAAGPVKGFAAIRMLRSEPEKAIPFLKERTKLTPAPAAEVHKRLMADLHSKSFSTREKATEALGGYGESIRSALEAELKSTTSADARTRLTDLVARLDVMSPARIRLVRAVEAVDGMSGPGATALLETWASGSAGTALAAEARTALARRRE